MPNVSSQRNALQLHGVDGPVPQIAIVTDSNAQLPEALVERLDVTVVDIPIVIDGDSRPEREIDVDDFYARLAEGAEVSTSQPSPGDFAAAYRRLASDGADAIVSIHVGSALSGTTNSARLAAELVDVPVDIVDTGQTSFSIGLCVTAAVAARDGGADGDAVADAARSAATRLGNVFVVSGLVLADGGGRLDVHGAADVSADEVPVVRLAGTDLDVVASVRDLDAAVAAMVDTIAREPGPLRVGVGVGDRGVMAIHDRMLERLRAMDHVVDVISYRCGPSVGAFSGPGVAGAAWLRLG